MSILISVINDKGLRFNVRLVKRGERYGLVKNGVPCLVHDKDDPLVEFYDDRHKIDGEIGQFVQRYYRSTLLDEEANRRARYPISQQGLCRCQYGLCLYAGVSAWEIDGVAFEMVKRALRAVM